MTENHPQTTGPAPGHLPTAPPEGRRSRKRASDGPLKIVDIYLLAHVMEATLRGLLWFGGLLVMVSVITAVRAVVKDGVGMTSMLELVLFQVPRIVLFALPMSVLYGTTQAFTELSTESEITAMAAGGLSLPRMMVAPLCWGAVLAVLAFGIQEFIVPGSQMRYDAVKREGVKAIGKGGFRWDDPPRGKGPLKRVIQAKDIDAVSGTLIKPVIQIYDENQRVKMQISAARGEWDMSTNRWKLLNGSTTFFGLRPSDGAWITKNTSKFREIWNSDAPSLGKLANSNTDARAAMDDSNYEYVSMWEIKNYRALMHEEKQTATTEDDRLYHASRVKSATFGMHDKIATPLICIALVLVGAPLGLRPPRAKGQSGVALGLSLAVLIVYYVVWTWCTTLAKNGHGHPVLFAYLSPLLTFVAGINLLVQKNR